MKNNASLVYSVCLVVGDFVALVIAFITAYFLRVKLAFGIDKAPIISNGRTFLSVFLLVLPFWILIFAFMGLYNSQIYEKRFKELGRLLVGSFIGLMLVIFWNFLADKPLFPARLVPIYGFGFAFIFLVVFRNLARIIRVLLFRRDSGLTRVVLVGNTDMTRELVDWLSDSRKSGYKVAGVVGGKQAIGNHPRVPLYPSFDQFLKQTKGELHGIIQTELYADEARNAKILEFAQKNHVNYRFVPGNTELFVGNIEVELFRSSIPVITVHQTPLFGWGRVVKRIFDLSVGVPLLILASPFMLLLALGVKLGDPKGPVFMRGKQQHRLTRFNYIFKVYKFRSHYAKYDGKTDEEVFAMIGKPELIEEYRKNGDKLSHDFRVTPFGRFIRATSLDELPQLINVVKGDISLVGPRPLVPQELTEYARKHTILSVKSGLTGLAVVSGRRDISFEERRKLDLYYVQNWSFWLDLIILAKTVRVVLGGGSSGGK
jgi:exopolysaccharide biosynthesis polyprenyl glycosylphosphotransferase